MAPLRSRTSFYGDYEELITCWGALGPAIVSVLFVTLLAWAITAIAYDAATQCPSTPAVRWCSDVTRYGWHHYWDSWFVLLVVSAVGLFMGVWFVLYTIPCHYYGSYLMDLPWRDGWPVLFVLATAFPIGWLFYAVSAIEVLWEHHRSPEPLAPVPRWTNQV